MNLNKILKCASSIRWQRVPTMPAVTTGMKATWIPYPRKEPHKWKALGVTLPLILVVLLGCAKEENFNENTYVEATIVGVSSEYAITYLKDEHGHTDGMNGIWGKVGDKMTVRCDRYGSLWRPKKND